MDTRIPYPMALPNVEQTMHVTFRDKSYFFLAHESTVWHLT